MQGQIFINELQGNFFLRTPKENKPTLLYYVVCYGGKKYRFATGVKVYPDHWNITKQEAYISMRLSELANINNTIVNEKIAEYKYSLSEFKAYLSENPNEIENGENLLRKYIYKNKHTPMNIDCIDYLEKCIEKANGISSGTRKDYLSTIKNLNKYCNKGNELKSFNDISKKYVKKYYDYLRCVDDRPNTKDGKLSLGYINKQISQLWNILNKFAVENEKMDYTVLAEWQERKGWIVADKSKKNQKGIALRDDEVLLLWDYWHKIDDEVNKDILATFLLECLTGQRFSDVEKLTDNIETINSITTISLVQKKGGKKVECGIIFKLAKEILSEYKNSMPKGYTNDYFNKRLKSIAKKAGIAGRKTDTRHSGTDSSVSIEGKERWELTTSHTGRRTFITLLKLREWDDRRIQMCSGHETIEMIQQYAKITSSAQYEVFKNGVKNSPEKILRYIDEDENVKLFSKPNDLQSNDEASPNKIRNTEETKVLSRIIEDSVDHKVIEAKHPDGRIVLVTEGLQEKKVETKYLDGKIITETSNHLNGYTIIETISNDMIETVYSDNTKKESKTINNKTGITEIEIVNHVESTIERKIINSNMGTTEEILIDTNTGLTEILKREGKKKTYVAIETNTGREIKRKINNQ